ncbi:hypothetical protein Ddc_02285 [Ditylenchus destructor]|nr:hypothetical protein Ddc_02285 [Ditylenchus destructor]
MLSYDLFFDVATFLPIKNRGTLCCISKDGYRALSQSIPKIVKVRFQFKEKVKENGAQAAFEWLDNEVDSTMFVTIAKMYLTGLSPIDYLRLFNFYPRSAMIKKLEPVVIEVNIARIRSHET